MLPLGKIQKEQKGFTLLEILIALFIISLILIPMMQLLGISYSTVQTAKEEQGFREEFRLYSSYLIEDLMFASNIHVQNTTEYDVLSFVAKSGKITTIMFDEKDGITNINGTEREPIVKGERYEDGIPMVRLDEDGVVRFNFFVRPLNVLFVTSVEPRTNEVIKK